MRNETLLVPSFAVLGLFAACGAESSTTPAERSAEPLAETPAEPAAAPAGSPTPNARPPDAKTATPEPTPSETEPAPTAALHVVALREGIVDLLVYRQAPVLSLDGEPVPWVKGRFTPEPGGAHGLPPTFDPIADGNLTLAFGGDSQAPLPTWVTYETIYDRSGPSYAVHHREGDRWRRVERAKGPLLAHHRAYVEREGALLGLQVWSPSEGLSYDEEMEDEASMAAARALERALQRARPTWVHLGGAKVAVPQIPAKTALASALTTADGTLHAITERQGEDSPHRLLRWRPGETKAEAVPVPGLEHAHEVSLSTSGGWVLAHGSIEAQTEDQADEGYLAMGHADSWERIPLPLPLGDRDMPPNVLAAARSPEGELWIALGVHDMYAREDQPVWRKPVDGSWEAVSLPLLEATAFGPSKEWMFENEYGRNDWVEHERGSIDNSSTRAVGLAWAAGAVWVALQLDGDSADHGPRSVVLTSDPKATEVTVLPPVWKTELHRANAASRSAKPGGRGCDSFTVVLGPASLATEHPEIVEAVDAIEVEDVSQPVSTIYVAQLDGAKVLVTRSQVGTPAQAEAVRKAAAAATGTDVKLVCHNPMLETAVKFH